MIDQIAGMEVDVFNAAARRALDEHGIRRFGFPRQLANALRDTHHLIAISGSPDILVRPFLADLGFDEVYGAQFEVVDGRFTSRATPVGDKAEILRRVIATGAVQQLGSVAVGDTISDFGMLAMADHQIAFNASRTLTYRASAQRWLRVNEVKDQVTALAYDAANDRYVEKDPNAIIAEVAA